MDYCYFLLNSSMKVDHRRWTSRLILFLFPGWFFLILINFKAFYYRLEEKCDISYASHLPVNFCTVVTSAMSYGHRKNIYSRVGIIFIEILNRVGTCPCHVQNMPLNEFTQA